MRENFHFFNIYPAKLAKSIFVQFTKQHFVGYFGNEKK